MDKCFICLEYTKKNICPVSKCNIKCHTKCYKDYLKFNNKEKFDCCPKCKGVPKLYNLRTRKCDKKCITIIKTYLHDIEFTYGREGKINFTKKLFEFLDVNKWFIYKHEKFANTVKDKLRYLYYDENLNFASYYHSKIFGSYL